MTSEELNRFKNGVQDIWSNDQLTDEQKRAALSVLSSKFNKSAFINIIEEPEQNLFPDSQWKMLLSLLELNNLNEINKLIMTTHSPYLINNFSVIVKANQLKSKIQNKKDLSEKTNAIVPLTSTINPDNLRVYEVDDKNGSINILDDYNGLPSDENYLNLGLAEANDLFAKLLDIEVLCQ